MPSNSETGHAKNVANFEDLISYCTAYGNTYNPSNPDLSIASLQATHAAAQAALLAVKTSKTGFDNATNARASLFAPLRKFTTRIINALAATGASEKTVEDAKISLRKIYGARSHSKLTKADAGKEVQPGSLPGHELPGNTDLPTDGSEPIGNGPKIISVSQQSYDSLIDHFAKLLQTLGAEPLYTPNEVDLGLTSLAALDASMRAANTAVINATTAYSNERINRDTIIYGAQIGLVDKARDVKKYVKSVFGAVSPQYRQISSLTFNRAKI